MKKYISLLLFATTLIMACSKGGSPSSTTNPGNNTSVPTISMANVAGLGFPFGTYGANVHIYGSGFSTTTTSDKLYFNGVAATIVSSTATFMVATVPFNAGTGNITLSVNGGTTITGPVFKYELPLTLTNLAGGSTVSPYANGTGTTAGFNYPTGVAVDASGNVYVADTNNSLIRKITPAGVTTTFAGNRTFGYTDGTGTAASFAMPYGLTVDVNGNIYVADGTIRKITPAGVVSTLSSSISGPFGIVVDGSGNLYLTDNSSHSIHKITPGGVVTTLAGSGTAGNTDGTGTAASFNQPRGIAIDGSGNLYTTDIGNYNIRKITPAGVVTTIAGNGAAGNTDGAGTAASFTLPLGITVDNAGNIYVSDYSIRKITPAGVVSTCYSYQITNGTSADVLYFSQPDQLAIDAAGNIYVADYRNGAIRKIKEITTP